MSHDARRCMQGNASHVLASNFYLPSVKTCPQRHADLPRRRCQSKGISNGPAWSIEGGEKRMRTE